MTSLWEKAVGFGVEIPFVTHLGFELTVFEGGRSEILYTPRPEHLNSFNVTHGGAQMTLLDVTMATAARSISPVDSWIRPKSSSSIRAWVPLPAPGGPNRISLIAFLFRVSMASLRVSRSGPWACPPG